MGGRLRLCHGGSCVPGLTLVGVALALALSGVLGPLFLIQRSSCGAMGGLPFEAHPEPRWAPCGFSAGPEDQTVLLVAVPDFSSTQTACLVNLRSLTCQPISFSGFGAEEEDLESLGLGP